jgi:putative transposase
VYKWRKWFGAMDVSDAERLKVLETENGRLKRLAAERDLEIEVMKEIAAKMVSAPGRRQQVEYARKRGLSCRRACALVQVARSSLRYRSKPARRMSP